MRISAAFLLLVFAASAVRGEAALPQRASHRPGFGQQQFLGACELDKPGV